MAAAIVLGFRYPGTWAFLILTRMTPGVGVLWFAFRREWRSLAIALGVTALIVLVSYLTVPDLWPQWIASLRTSVGQSGVEMYGPLWLRLPVALAVLWYAARTDRRWLVPVVCLIAMPNIWALSWALLAGCFGLYVRPYKAKRDPALRLPDGG